MFRKENIKKQKSFSKSIDGLLASFYRGIISVMTLPTKAYISLDAMIRTIYRMKVTKEHLLEWTTSEEAERQNKNRFLQVFLKMLPNILVSAIIFVIIPYTKCAIFAKGLMAILGVLFLTAPFLMMDISRKKTKKKMILKLNGEEQSYIKGVAEKTWGYFAEFMTKENSYLPPDNYQESRREKIIDRTSSTNIGLGILAVISAYDLKFVQLDKALTYLENILNTVEKLEKWNGHLYNWYNIRTLKPLAPRYISTVDSGNFVRIYVYFENVFRGKTWYTV